MPDNIPSYDEVTSVIHAFYEKLLVHPQLGHFFEHLEDFPVHEKRIVDFWWISMGGKLENPPKIDMIGKHFPLGIKDADLEVWLGLFSETLQQELAEDKGIYWMDKVMTIAARLKQIVIDNQGMGAQIKK
ncbi:MAG TPA: group III truncated hemoglobin [Gammaproteobacteria bacterium]|nr:group III truncated hemoglobin [Gammaproteobacteria bacterium]